MLSVVLLAYKMLQLIAINSAVICSIVEFSLPARKAVIYGLIRFQRDPIPSEYMTRDPEHRQIYRFIRTLFHAAQLTAECAIITLV